MRLSKKIAQPAGRPDQANIYQQTQPLNFAPLATSHELFSYADTVGAAITKLPASLKTQAIRHFLAVCRVALTAA